MRKAGRQRYVGSPGPGKEPLARVSTASVSGRQHQRHRDRILLNGLPVRFRPPGLGSGQVGGQVVLESGGGTVRGLRPSGSANSWRRVAMCFTWRRISTRPRGKSTSSGESLNTPPCLNGSPAARVTTRAYRSGSVSRTRRTMSACQAMTFRGSALGRRTEDARHFVASGSVPLTRRGARRPRRCQ